MPEPKDILTSHNYDGIQEFDNPTPGWWSWLFAGSIVFGLIYAFIFITCEDIFGVEASHERAETALLMRQFAELGELTGDAATLDRFVNDPDEQKWLAAGESIFRANCVACHGTGGVGLSGSGANLTDDAYLHVRKVEDIVKVVNNGANNGAMPAWQNKLQANEVVLVSAYVASLRGTNAPGGTLPQGEEIPPFFETSQGQ